ncbi:MAG: 8-oxo-dGTP diphosphatase [Clostridia bacterium]|nr:8-oxo-dGTP diphosphatase [Clostridia bacterium]
MKTQLTTLLLIIQDNNILLAEKKRGFGAGKYNGIGGKVEPNETIEEAMIRETQEEIGVTPINYKKQATITFDEWVNGEEKQVIMSVFVAKDYIGKIIETEEMKPMWFETNNIPYEKMFEDDKTWLPEILKGNTLNASFVFDKDFKMLSSKIDIID